MREKQRLNQQPPPAFLQANVQSTSPSDGRADSRQGYGYPRMGYENTGRVGGI
jgi:hypothetical protein